MHIKICGVTTPEDAELAARLGANAIGLNFYPQSPRRVSVEMADLIIGRLPPLVDAVGVLVRPEFGVLQNLVLSLRLRSLQLHDFPVEQWPELVHLRRGNAIILACSVANLEDRLRFEAELDQWQRKLPLVLKMRESSQTACAQSPLELVAWLEEKLAPNAPAIAVLFDAKVPGQHGGTGQQAPWHLLADWQLPYPLILAGGLTPENVAEAIRIVRPYAVDVASGVESAPGVKDAEKLRRFIGNAREAAAKFLTL